MAMARKYEMTIGGRQVPSADYREIRNPADDSVVGLCPIGTVAHLEQAVTSAESAFGSWRQSTDDERAAACSRIAAVITENVRELSILLTQEQGKPLKGLGSEFELGGCAAWAGYTASLSLPPKVIETSPTKRIVLQREPIGV